MVLPSPHPRGSTHTLIDRTIIIIHDEYTARLDKKHKITVPYHKERLLLAATHRQKRSRHCTQFIGNWRCMSCAQQSATW